MDHRSTDDTPVFARPTSSSLGKAIELCAELGGFEMDKQLAAKIDADKTQLSRWQSDQEGIKWDKLAKLMDACGNDAPVMWMLAQRGYDLHSLRKLETETERQLRLALEENAALRRALLAQV